MNNLSDFSKEQLIGLLQKANKRRKRESKKLKKEAGLYYRAFIHERDAQAKTCANFRKYMDEVEARELQLHRRESEVKRWRNHVDELVNKENQQFRLLYSAQECSCCKEMRWRRKYRETYSGMSEFCSKYIHIVDDMMRQKNLPDNVKARLCDMRIAFVESRDFLDKVMRETESAVKPIERPIYVIRVNSAYLNRLYVQQEADTDERKAAVFNRVIENITEYLHTSPKENIRFGVHFKGDSWEQNTWSFDLTVDAGGDPSLAVIADVMRNELRRMKLNIKV